MRRFLVGLAAAAAFATAGEAQVETVVVTGERASTDTDAPSVTLTERADHLVTKVKVTCDTRDAERRKDELRQTLRGMIDEAKRTSSISLSVGDEILTDFTEKKIDKIMTNDSRADTSDAYVVIRTELTKDDTFDGATQRIKDFIARTPKIGRTEILNEQPFNLGIAKAERYRPELIRKIADESKQTALLFGASYDLRIEGMQRTMQWYQSGPLDLALYIPYTLTIVPRGGQ